MTYICHSAYGERALKKMKLNELGKQRVELLAAGEAYKAIFGATPGLKLATF